MLWSCLPLLFFFSVTCPVTSPFLTSPSAYWYRSLISYKPLYKA
jgi:hypothetical protein